VTSDPSPGPVPDKVFAMHQPNYLPWLGYFSKIAATDVFVVLDSVQYPRGTSFAARNRIKTSNGPAYLTVPVSVPKGNEGRASYLDIRCVDQKWRRKHLKSLELAYKRAPHYDEVVEMFQGALVDGTSLVDINLSLITTIARYLGIETEMVRLSELLDEHGQKSHLIVDIGAAIGAGTYLSGTGGGQEYNDEDLLRQHGIELRYSDFEVKEYPQLWGPFEPRLSALDALFNCGPDAAELLVATP
jgi:hypothetical protein